MILIGLLIVAFSQISTLYGQNQSYDYHPPLSIPLILAGNFGELRPNHFHMGLDFKTQGKEGHQLHAIEDGFISRVKISTYGYGKAVYIDHPNGKTSVYAHCSKFIGKLDSLVKEEQYKKQQFEVELFFNKDILPIKKGEVFALSGNTGGSTAPHLHFEIRDSKTEVAQNPLIHGFPIADSRAPELRKIKFFSTNEQGYLVPGKAFETVIQKTKNGYKISNDTIRIPADYCSNFGGIGIAVDAIDRLNGAENQCGLYGSFLIVNGDTLFGQQINEISFDHTRYINTHRDLSSSGTHYHKAFRNISNPLEIYTLKHKLGIIHAKPNDTLAVRYIGYDVAGNQSQLDFQLVILPGKIAADYNPSPETHWYPEESYTRKAKNWEVIADSFTVYEPYPISTSNAPHYCSASTHLQKRATVRMKLDNPTLPIEKYYLTIGKSPIKTRYIAGWLEGKTNSGGSLTIQTDQIPPTIKPASTSTIIKTKIVKFTISDNQSGIDSYHLFINDKWHLLEYEYKGSYVFFEVPENLEGENTFKLIVRDNCGNETIWEKVLTVQLPTPPTP